MQRKLLHLPHLNHPRFLGENYWGISETWKNNPRNTQKSAMDWNEQGFLFSSSVKRTIRWVRISVIEALGSGGRRLTCYGHLAWGWQGGKRQVALHFIPRKGHEEQKHFGPRLQYRLKPPAVPSYAFQNPRVRVQSSMKSTVPTPSEASCLAYSPSNDPWAMLPDCSLALQGLWQRR